MSATKQQTLFHPAKSILTVSQLTGLLRTSIESQFADLWLEGEVSNLRMPGSGHVYCTLKDEFSQIRAVLFRSSAVRLKFSLQEGMCIIVRGRLTVYEPRGEYQIVLDSVEPKGIGALQLAFEQLKKRLAGEGLFDEAKKTPLPPYPSRVGIVTSPTGAAIRDMLSVLHRRWPTLQIIIVPVPVQGEGAAAKIAEAIRFFPTLNPRPDLLIVARGGGSIEDLWAFNEEEVVRAAAESPIPLISAVGHETDTTLIDHASDRRAPTPTAAAEMAVPVRTELLAELGEFAHRAQHCLTRRTERARERFDLTICRWPEPQAIFQPMNQRLDNLTERLPRSLAARAGNARADMNLIAGRLRQDLVDQKIARLREKLAATWKMADLAHPERPLQRGFARVTDRAGKTLASVAAATAARELRLRFTDGEIDAAVGASGAPAPVERKPKRAYVAPQPGLFDAPEE